MPWRRLRLREGSLGPEFDGGRRRQQGGTRCRDDQAVPGTGGGSSDGAAAASAFVVVAWPWARPPLLSVRPGAGHVPACPIHRNMTRRRPSHRHGVTPTQVAPKFVSSSCQGRGRPCVPAVSLSCVCQMEGQYSIVGENVVQIALN